MSKPQRITEESNFHIKPRDINAEKFFLGAFGNCETEVSARWIVRFLQQENVWRSFHYSEINAFYKSIADQNHLANEREFNFHHLVGPIFKFWSGSYSNRLDLVIREGNPTNDNLNILENELFSVTDQFILRCHEAAPILV